MGGAIQMKRLQKNITSIIIALLLIQGIPIHSYGIGSLTSHPVYEGMENAATHFNNVSFKDIENHWAKESIQEIGSLSYMMGSNRNFGPNRNLTYIEALITLVRAIGMEEEAQRIGQQQTPPKIRDLILLSPLDSWSKGYVQVANDANILTDREINEIINLSPKELERIERDLERQLKSYQGKDYSQGDLQEIERQVRDAITNKAYWHKPVSRQQVATWIARALNIDPIYGDNIKLIYQFNDWQKADGEKISYIEPLLQRNILKGTSRTTFSPTNNIKRGEMAQIIYNIQDEILPNRGLHYKKGQIIKIEDLNDLGTRKILYTIKNYDNTMNYISLIPSQRKNLIVQKDKKLGLSSLLKEGEHIKYYIDSKDTAIYAKVLPNTTTELIGFIDFADGDNKRLSLMDLEDKLHHLQGDNSTIIKLNGRSASFKDLHHGQEAKILLRDNKIISIETYIDEDSGLDGYIAPGTRVKVGDVLFIDRDKIELRTSEGRETYRLQPTTKITRNGKKANLFEIKTGDRLLLSFNDIYSPDISEIRVEDQERHIQAVYRGVLDHVNTRAKEIILKDVLVYNEGKWNNHPDQKVKLRVEGQEIYSGATKITLNQLDSHRGKEIYTAVEESFGTQRGAKLLVKEGSTMNYYDKITSLEFGTSRMEVDNNYVYFHPGTIVIKNNRMVDMLNLDLNQSIYLASDFNRGTRRAAFVDINYTGIIDDRIDGTRLLVYKGKIEDIKDYGLKIGKLSYQLDYLKLEDNQWKEIAKSQDMILTEDTYIYDSQLKLQVPTAQFIGSRFVDPDDIKDITLRNRIKNNFYTNKTAYFVVRETTYQGNTQIEVLALNLTPDLPNYREPIRTDHVAIGEIGSVDLDTGNVTLTKIRNWNSLSKRWELAPADNQVNLEKAVILVNDQPISQEELYRLKPRGKVYILKNKSTSTGDTGYVLIVEQ